ncbi:unnamed protein product [Lathyrus oleraceus]|uniref:X8 domain-containing protein n=2 Tax=Pisum sativum TaxID=3888 RepID=A0A9D4ZWP2_PEA|nr:hypothetical protein KIW84_071887 [Pisum sativum]
MAESNMISIKLILTFVTTMILVNVMVVSADKAWCVAKEEASEQQLLGALNYVCGIGVDCRPIQPNGNCYYPNTVRDHVSYAFNTFYQLEKHGLGTCDFSGSAHVVYKDPSKGSCVYPSN